MAKTFTKMCRICLTNNIEDNITDSSCYTKFFIQVIGLKEIREPLWLCMWCKAAVRKAIALFKLALESENNFHNKINMASPSTDIPTTKPKSLHLLNFIQNSHIDIPPFPIEYQDFKTENILEEIEEAADPLFEKDYEIQIKENTIKLIVNLNEESFSNGESIVNKESFSNKESMINKESLSNKESILNKELISKKEYETAKSKIEIKKRNKKEFDFRELKFEVEYLNLEEQLKEVELKKLKYQDFEFHCDECGLGFLTSDVFEEHKIKHSELSGPHKCPICSLHFKSRDVFSQHSLTHKRRFSCLLCGSKYKRWSHCVAHRYKCGKMFSNEYSLKIHMKVRKAEKKYCCDQCDKKFSGKHRLTVHMRSHTGIKPFSCAQCARSFTTRSNLRAHGAVHRHTTDFYCVECNTYYKTAKSLKRHFNESAKHAALKNDMYSCEECTKQFCTEKALNNHISTRHGTEYRCTHCDKTFSNNSNLNKHIKCIHTAK